MVTSTVSKANNSSSSSKVLNNNKLLVAPLETTSKPPGTSRFSRSRNDFDKDTIAVITTNTNSLILNRSDILETEIQLESDICKQLLINGYVQSYIDFYHLTNRADPLSDPSKKEITKIRTSVDHMLFIRDKLLDSENARRQGNTNDVYIAYNSLADSFAKIQDWRTSIFFHEKRLEVAQIISDDKAIMNANQSLGLVHQQIHEYEIARKFHEKQEQFASKYDLVEETARAHAELFKVYMFLASDLEHDKNHNDALDMYKRCLNSAIKCWNKPAEGVANGKIGNLLLSQGLAKESIPFLRAESNIATEMADADGRCKASSALAFAFDILGEADKALEELTLVHTISEQAGDASLQAKACKALGILYSKVGKFELAAQCLYKHFILVKGIISKQSNKSSEDREFTSQDLDLARVYVGISKGNHLMGSYICAMQFDFDSLLSWKLSRAELPDPYKPIPVPEEEVKEETIVTSDDNNNEENQDEANKEVSSDDINNNVSTDNNNNTTTEEEVNKE